MRNALWIMVTNLLIGELFNFSLGFMSVATMRCILTPVMNSVRTLLTLNGSREIAVTGMFS